MRRLYCRVFGHKWCVIKIDDRNNVCWKICTRCASGGGFKIRTDRQFTEWQLKRRELGIDD